MDISTKLTSGLVELSKKANRNATGPRETKRDPGKDMGPWGTEEAWQGHGASTETGEHTGSEQRPHKTRDL